MFAQRAIFRTVPGKTQCGTKVRVPLQTELARTTWNSRVNRHALPIPLTAFDPPSKFVAEDERPDKPLVADACLCKPV
jgi:hypothetical protein